MRSKARFLPPERFRRQIDEAVERYRAWRGDDGTVAFTYVTDVHSYRGGMSDPPDYTDTKNHIPLELFTADMIDADFVADMGDMDFDTPGFNVANMTARFESQMAIYGSYRSRPIIFSCGNHDYGPVLKGMTNRALDSKMFGEAFCRMSSRAGFKGFTFGEDNASWGYYDMPEKKTRVFFLNSSDTGYYGFSKSQLDFLVRNAASTPEGWTLMVTHHCSTIWHYRRRRESGKAPAFNPKYPNTDTINEIEIALANGLKGSFRDISWDFTSFKERGIRLAGVFCGDAHYDSTVNFMGVNCCVSQGYGKYAWEAPTTLAQIRDSPHEFLDLERDCLFEIVACKTGKRQVHVFRVGAGGAGRDREWRY